MGELRSALDALAAEDIRGLAPRQQLDRITDILEARTASMPNWPAGCGPRSSSRRPRTTG